jgi:hypothetical protein
VRVVPSNCLIEHSPSVACSSEFRPGVCGTLCNVFGSFYRIEWVLPSMCVVSSAFAMEQVLVSLAMHVIFSFFVCFYILLRDPNRVVASSARWYRSLEQNFYREQLFA